MMCGCDAKCNRTAHYELSTLNCLHKFGDAASSHHHCHHSKVAGSFAHTHRRVSCPPSSKCIHKSQSRPINGMGMTNTPHAIIIAQLSFHNNRKMFIERRVCFGLVLGFSLRLSVCRSVCMCVCLEMTLSVNTSTPEMASLTPPLSTLVIQKCCDVNLCPEMLLGHICRCLNSIRHKMTRNGVAKRELSCR